MREYVSDGGMSKAAFERKIGEIKALGAKPKSEATLEALRKALRDKNNFAVSKAAEVAATLEAAELAPDLAAAFHRFLANAVKTDPQCWAKNAIAQALRRLTQPAEEIYLRGARHIQLEPVFGGVEDTAATLRGYCAFALVECTTLPAMRILEVLVDLLADRERSVRVAAVQAIANLGSECGALLLRLKAHAGDESSEVTGACFSGLFVVEQGGAAGFVARFLDSGSEGVRLEAAAALGESRDAEALAVLIERWRNERSGPFRRALLVAAGLSRMPQAAAFLLPLVDPTNLPDAEPALEALKPFAFQEDIRAQIAARAAEGRLLEIYRREFEP